MVSLEQYFPKFIHSFTIIKIAGAPILLFSSVQSLSRVRLCDPMDRSTPGFTVHHQLPELAQTHVHRVGDAPLYLKTEL